MPWSTSDRRAHLPPNWPQLRKAVFTRDNWTCVDCHWHDPTARTLECDHLGQRDDHRLELLTTRCRACHRRKTAKAARALQSAPEPRTRPAERHPGLT